MLRIKEVRTSKGYGQTEFAKLLGRHRVSYAKIENGVANPSLKTLNSIARLLNVHIIDLFEKRS